MLAGLSETSFTIHKDLVCHHSDFFTAACSSVWSEGKDGKVRLPAIETQTFKLYAHWVYASNIDLAILDLPQPMFGPFSTLGFAQMLQMTFELFRLYVAADMLLDQRLKSRTIDILLIRINENQFMVSNLSLNYVWASTREGALLRRLVADWVTVNPSATFFAQIGPRLSKECLLALMVRQMERCGQTAQMPTLRDRCAYHEHKAGEVCLSTTN